MADFPRLAFSLEGEEETQDGVLLERAGSGIGRGRALWDSEKRVFNLVFPALEAAEVTTLRSFYSTYRGQLFIFRPDPCDAATVGVTFSTAPRYRHLGAGLTRVSFQLVEFP